MFRDGQYLEVIKASDNCLATAVVTVQERTIKIKEKKVSTNKWLDLEDWAALYKILEKAILRDVPTDGSLQDSRKCKWKKSTRQLDVTYTFEPSECAKDATSLPTIRVNVSPAKRKMGKTVIEKGEIRDRSMENVGEKPSNCTHRRNNGNTATKKVGDSDSITKVSSDIKNDRTKRHLTIESIENDALEEYVPDAPLCKKLCANLNYVPSRKSTLERTQPLSNEYSPVLSDDKSVTEVVRYIPNSIDWPEISYETYEPSAMTTFDHPEEYIPNSKGIKVPVEEYHPDFTSKSMKFDNSYVPSSVQLANENTKMLSEGRKTAVPEKHVTVQKRTSIKRNLHLFT